jgi:hypothetical protein
MTAFTAVFTLLPHKRERYPMFPAAAIECASTMPQSDFAALSFRFTAAIVTLALCCPPASAAAQGPRIMPPSAPVGENLYCAAGDIPAFGTNDGPATLPQSCYDTDLSVTPSPGKTTLVSAGQSVGAKLSKAACGDVVELAAGTSFAPFTVPFKDCDANHYITIRTSAPDASLPAEGTRITPCFAGLASLPNHPAYPCPAPANVMAQIVVVNPNGSGIAFAAGADYYRFIGLEVTRAAGIGTVRNLINANHANHVIFDRMWIHGTETDTTSFGVSLDTSNYIAVIDSYLDNFHCSSTAPGCLDNKAITGGSSAVTPEGTWKFVNNFLEAAAETIGFGIASSSTTVAPVDIEIRHNYMYRPTSWMLGDPNYNGLSFTVRDHVVFKNGLRALLEGNVLQNSWAGFGKAYGQEQGPAFLLSPRIAGAAVSCATCFVTNITIRYNYASHLPQAIAFTSPGNTTEKYASGNNSFSIHDDVFDDLNYPGCSGCATVFSNAIFGGTNANVPPLSDVLHDLTINHITEVSSAPPLGLLSIGGTTAAFPPQESNILISNSIFYAGTKGFTNPGGGTASCEVVSSGAPQAIFDNCWSSYTFAANVVVGGAALPLKNLTWPASTFLPPTDSDIQFVNLNGGIGGDYHLQTTSPYSAAGTDGQDIGANLDSVNTYTSGAIDGTWN